MARIKKTQTPSSSASFISAVDSCAEIKGKARPGLSALRTDSKMLKADNPRLIDGSVDIDTAVKNIYPADSRWDYAVEFNGQVFFIEIHPADTANIDEMIKKVKWLKAWLPAKAPMLKSMHRCGVYHWIPTGRVKISPNSRQFLKIAVNKLLLTTSPFHLDKR